MLPRIHAAKGLEFDYVFVAGHEDGILPFTLFEKFENRQNDEAGKDDEEILVDALYPSRTAVELRTAHPKGRTKCASPCRRARQARQDPVSKSHE